MRNTVLGILAAGLVEPDPLLYELIVEVDGEVLGRLGDRISSEGAEAFLALMIQRAQQMDAEEIRPDVPAVGTRVSALCTGGT